MAAIPGTFNVVCKDQARALNFVTGKELTLRIDGVLMFGGYVLQVTRENAFSADKTTPLSDVHSRQWLLSGADYNILFDKRVLRQPSSYTTQIDKLAGPITDGAVIRGHFADWFDIPSGFDFTNATNIGDKHTFSTGYRVTTQGVFMREVMEDLARYGSIYYIDAAKKLHFVPVQETLADWGLSDRPNNTTFIGFRDGEMTEDATGIVNDALVWGGSEWASTGTVVFARRENDPSIAAHGRWQVAENHTGDENYKIQDEVTARAKVIVDGNESGTFAEGSKGLVNPEKQLKATWFAHDVPGRVHTPPGYVVPINLWVFSPDGGTTPFSMNVPLRQMNISFPDLDASTGTSYVEFGGFFGVLMSDPHWLWSYLRQLRAAQQARSNTMTTSTATNTTVTPSYGAFYQGEPSPLANGTAVDFAIPFAFIGGTVEAYINGLLQRPDIDYAEVPPNSVRFSTPPFTDDEIWITARLTA